jgi:hypothetical protein
VLFCTREPNLGDVRAVLFFCTDMTKFGERTSRTKPMLVFGAAFGMTFAGGLRMPLRWSCRGRVLVCTREPNLSDVRAVLFFCTDTTKFGEPTSRTKPMRVSALLST